MDSTITHTHVRTRTHWRLTTHFCRITHFNMVQPNIRQEHNHGILVVKLDLSQLRRSLNTYIRWATKKVNISKVRPENKPEIC